MDGLGDRLRTLRNDRDMSLRELAKELGDVSAAHLSDIEFGRRHPSDALLNKLATFFDVELDDLRQLDPRPPIEEIKQAARNDPRMGFAFRQVVHHKIRSEELLDFIEQRQSQADKQ